jgi:hypothetical protein
LGLDLVISSEIKYQYLNKSKKINDTYREYSAMKGGFLAKKKWRVNDLSKCRANNQIPKIKIIH